MNIWYWLWGMSILPILLVTVALLLYRMFLRKNAYKLWKVFLLASALLIMLRITLTATMLVVEGSVLDYLSLLLVLTLIIIFS